MLKISITHRPRSAKVLHEIVRKEVREEYKNFCEDAVKRLKKDIATWEHQPTFHYKYAAGEKLWYVNISFDNKDEAGKIYHWVDAGTAENAGKGGKYPIVARRAKALQFPVPTRVKTTPGVAGIPGIVISQGNLKQRLITVKKVMHPGIRPRNFVKSLRTELTNRASPKSFHARTDAAIKRGNRKIGKNAR